MKLNKKSISLILSITLSAIGMSLIDGYIQLSYLNKSIFKIFLFSIVPMGYFFWYREEWNQLKKLFVLRRSDLKVALLLGAGVFSIIVMAYSILRNFIDLSIIRESLTSNIGVTADNFLYVAIYITLVNSLLEEFFFRGFAFLILKENTGRFFAYVFSALLFALYHVGMTSGWFNWGIYLLAMLGLFAGGCIFNYLNEKSESIYPSWLVHIFANLAINTVGFILFGLI
ncbi:MAG: CPBP family intramembrane glutamic endopeptidase [Alkalibacterium gilvum]|uniref:CAAX protease self-immunity n=1 Tax=Alkalibacterium gilvum TaxID=1130080 RepID=A0A1H6VNC7_9LACT|nr:MULTISPECIES: type II CAAX endopeptidase family protein [Alkalibacterium]MDN6293306.1 CPBP family intramembrane metalloprotease [Alkalibacterium sp.]MDN6295314.1 CPBP family intramembrane metalloprotease [Alkalibacterium sp.]SEJ05196.1 CAAX protease self-immunity [Alkalibacterium gilvum]